MRSFLVLVFRAIMRVYFRSVQSVGAVPPATTRGRLFVANHHNAMVDPVLILTDAACPISPVAKSTLWRIPGLRWLLDVAQAVPVVRRQDVPDRRADANDAAFDKIASHLASGGNLLIFPEGKSHSEPSIAPLRPGAAKMALDAAALVAAAPHDRSAATRCPITVQAVVLEFDQADTFRSRSAIVWGPVRTVSANPSMTPATLTAQMAADLQTLLVTSDDRDERLLVSRIAQLWANHTAGSCHAQDELGEELSIAHTVSSLGSWLKAHAPDAASDVQQRVTAYFATLAQARLRDADVAHFRTLPMGATVGKLLLLAVTWPLWLVGVLLYGLPYPLPRLVARRADDHDMVSTIKLGVALVMYPAWATLLMGLAAWQCPMPWLLAALGGIWLCPFAAIWWQERWACRPGRLRTRTARMRTTLVRQRQDAMTAIMRAQQAALNAGKQQGPALHE